MPQSQSQPLGVYVKTTHCIKVTVRPFYLKDQSEPEADHFVWAYHVRIENHGDETVQLLTRHWQITDAAGGLQDVCGEGVVGKKPVLRPGEMFEYASGASLSTPSGIMVGSYRLKTDHGEDIDVAIPAFSLDSPHTRGALH